MDASSLKVPVSSAGGSPPGRNRVALKPGRSLMDWIRYTSRNDVTGTDGKYLEISLRELARHNTRNDAWIALRGKVYNITHYLEFHPGGEDELMRGAGNDATELFNQVHRWVNAESMLQKCFIGILKKSWSFDVPKFLPLKQSKVKHMKTITVDSVDKECKTVSKNESKEIPIVSDIASSEMLEEMVTDIQRTTAGKSVWSLSPYSKSDASRVSVRFDEDGNMMKLFINCSALNLHGLITDLVDRKLFIRINDSPEKIISFEFPTAYEENFKVETEDNSFVEITLKKKYKAVIGKFTCDEVDSESSQVVPFQNIPWNVFEPSDELIFWSCKLTRKIPVNHNTFLFTFLLPPGTKMWVPLGSHVHIKSYIEGIEVIRSYTPVVSSLDVETYMCDELDGCRLVLMIKIYPTGIMTPVINQCNLGESLWISNYAGNFSETLLLNCDSAIMLAAGTGITPMVRLINWILTAKDKKRSVLLLFFNKTEEDIIWKKELQICSEKYSKFQVVHILSEPSEIWTGFSGKINDDLMYQLLTMKMPELKQQIFVCGPSPFTEIALRCLEGLGYNQDDVYAFTGS
ncbi:cytochrome b5 reductase 4-like [Argiope bruennichi]|uniref:Cytochrome b5 reductase 4 like protein n=1 Tax=Argiope bruennichi TaxID=94029 RepID=A0A8T0FIQ0_ARGBR|nr:cytochrome b5 reductase 4-like [Argiope bruennichi]KAF8790342.1 Cytochrome b5 reductase 4 like protein [Argiope bruennichi]